MGGVFGSHRPLWWTRPPCSHHIVHTAQVLQRKLEEVSMENMGMMVPHGGTNVGLVVEGGALVGGGGGAGGRHLSVALEY